MSSTNEIKILFFASLREAAGLRETTLPWEAGSVRELKQALLQRFPALQDRLPSALIAVNQVYVQEDAAVLPGAEVALFPPVSGG